MGFLSRAWKSHRGFFLLATVLGGQLGFVSPAMAAYPPGFYQSFHIVSEQSSGTGVSSTDPLYNSQSESVVTISGNGGGITITQTTTPGQPTVVSVTFGGIIGSRLMAGTCVLSGQNGSFSSVYLQPSVTPLSGPGALTPGVAAQGCSIQDGINNIIGPLHGGVPPAFIDNVMNLGGITGGCTHT